MKVLSRLSTAIIISIGLALFIGCAQEDTTAPTVDSTAANAWVGTANTLLEANLMNLINDQAPENPGDVNLTEPYNAYVKALEADDSNPSANFGAGMLEIIMISQDAEFQDFFDRTKAFMDSATFFEVPGMAGAPAPGPRLKFRLDKSVLPLESVIRLEANMSSAAAAGDPTIGEFQDLLARKLIPRYQTAIARLKKVASHPDFKFMITPRMQGDPGEDAIELDLTEIYAAIAACDVQLAFLDQFCAYGYDMGDWTGEAMRTALTQGSPFMALRSGGAGRMNAAGQAWLDAVNNLDAGVQFLESETDDQSNDLIKIDHNDHSDQEALDSVKIYIPRVRRVLTSQETFTFDFGNGDEDLTIALSAMFNSPVNDLKALIPPYTVTLDTVAGETDHRYTNSQVTANVQVPSQNYYYWYRYASYSDGQLEYYDESKPFDAAPWDSAFDAWDARFQSKSYAYINIVYSGYLDAGIQDLTADISCDYDETTSWRYAPRITWQADNFGQWIFPDPTMGGLLPGMTDSRIKRIMDITGDGWEKSVSLNMWN